MGIKRYWRNLAVEVNSKELRVVFERLKSEHKIFGRYPDTKSLRDLMRPKNKKYKDKDEIMAILLGELHKSNAIYPLINLMFWDSLYRLFSQRRRWVADQKELFSMIQYNFYYCLMSHDPKRLPRKIDVNIYLNTKKKVTAWEKENLRYKDELDYFKEQCRDDLTFADFEESRFYTEEMSAYLLSMVLNMIITRAQYELVIATLVIKSMNMRVWAERKGVNYHTTRNLRYRAEVAVRQSEEENINYFIEHATKWGFDGAVI